VSLPVETKRGLVDLNEAQLSVRRQCELLGLNRSSLYYQPVWVSAEELWLMKQIDELYMAHPYYGSRRITAVLNTRHSQCWNRKRIQRLMRQMGIQGLAPGPATSRPHPEHKIYPYRLRGVSIDRVNQVWSTDITFIPMAKGFMYLVAVIDWYSRYVLSWALSNTQDVLFCLDALEQALEVNQPEIFNTDQGAQFTSQAFTERLLDRHIQISMDGRGRALDNVFIERLWRSLKYENIYINEYLSVAELRVGLAQYFQFYNHERLHQSLNYTTPAAVYGL
jgi:putative transposase